MEQTDTKKWVKIVFSVMGLCLLFGLIVSGVNKRNSSFTNTLNILINEIEGSENLITKEDVELFVERKFGNNLVGIQIGDLNVDKVEKALEENEFIKNADVFVNARNIVNVIVTQNVPVLRIIDSKGASYYLDEWGQRIPVSKHYTARLMVATGNIPAFNPGYRDMEDHIIKDLHHLCADIMADEFLKTMVEQIFVTSENGYVLIPKVGRQKIVFGYYENVEDKLFRLKTFYKKGLPYEGWSKYKRIDLRYKGQVVCKKTDRNIAEN